MKISVFVFSLLFVNSVFSMLRIQTGVYNLEGYIEKEPKSQSIYFILNKRTNSRIDILLDNVNLNDVLYKDGQKVKLNLKIDNPISGPEGTARLIKLIKVIKPSSSVRIYNTENDLN